MLNKLTYRRKNRLLAAGAVLLLMLVYSLSVSKTLTLRSTCTKLEKRLDSAASIPAETEMLERKLQRLEKNFSSDSLHENLHEDLLSIVSGYCDQRQLVLREFPEKITTQSPEWDIETHQFTVAGNFSELLRLVHLLESRQTGKIVSADYQRKRDPKTKTLSLTVTVYVQQLKKTTS